MHKWACVWEKQRFGFRPGLTQTGQYSHRRLLEAGNFGFKKRNCTIHVAKTKALISFAVTAKLICANVFAYADCWFSHVAAQMSVLFQMFLERLTWLSHMVRVFLDFPWWWSTFFVLHYKNTLWLLIRGSVIKHFSTLKSTVQPHYNIPQSNLIWKIM